MPIAQSQCINEVCEECAKAGSECAISGPPQCMFAGDGQLELLAAPFLKCVPDPSVGNSSSDSGIVAYTEFLGAGMRCDNSYECAGRSTCVVGACEGSANNCSADEKCCTAVPLCGACSVQAECDGKYYCDTSAAYNGRCLQRVNEGGACERTEQCHLNAVCANNSCVRRASMPNGARCFASGSTLNFLSLESECMSGYCVNGFCASPPAPLPLTSLPTCPSVVDQSSCSGGAACICFNDSSTHCVNVETTLSAITTWLPSQCMAESAALSTCIGGEANNSYGCSAGMLPHQCCCHESHALVECAYGALNAFLAVVDVPPASCFGISQPLPSAAICENMLPRKPCIGPELITTTISTTTQVCPDLTTAPLTTAPLTTVALTTAKASGPLESPSAALSDGSQVNSSSTSTILVLVLVPLFVLLLVSLCVVCRKRGKFQDPVSTGKPVSFAALGIVDTDDSQTESSIALFPSDCSDAASDSGSYSFGT